MTSPSVLSNRPAVLDTRAILDAVDAVLADAPVRSSCTSRGSARASGSWCWTASIPAGCRRPANMSTQFEQMVAAATGVRHAIAIVNGTAALHAALLLEGVKPNDEVILPSITFVATANAVSHAGAVPHFVDSTWTRWGSIRPRWMRHLQEIAAARGGETVNRQTGRTIRAIVPVHIFGHPVDMAPLLAVAAKYGLVVVEDATESLGSTWQGRTCGSFGHSSVLSFNGNKIVTTGGGGMILTEDDELRAARAAFHHHREEAACLVVRSRRGRLQLSAAQHQRRARLRADGEAAGIAREASAGLPNVISMSSRALRARGSSASRRARGAITGSTRWCWTASLPPTATACWVSCTPMACGPARYGPRCICFRCTATARARRWMLPRTCTRAVSTCRAARSWPRGAIRTLMPRIVFFTIHRTTPWWTYLASRIDFADVTVLSDLRGEGDYSLVDDFYRFMRKGDAAAAALARFGENGCADIIRRCRVLRSLDRGLAMNMIGGMAQAIEVAFDHLDPRLLLTFTMDRYVIDVMARIANARGIDFLEMTSLTIPDHVIFHRRGQLVQLRDPSDEELGKAVEILSEDGFTPVYVRDVKKFSRTQFWRIYCYFALRGVFFNVWRCLRRDPLQSALHRCAEAPGAQGAGGQTSPCSISCARTGKRGWKPYQSSAACSSACSCFPRRRLITGCARRICLPHDDVVAALLRGPRRCRLPHLHQGSSAAVRLPPARAARTAVEIAVGHLRSL